MLDWEFTCVEAASIHSLPRLLLLCTRISAPSSPVTGEKPVRAGSTAQPAFRISAGLTGAVALFPLPLPGWPALPTRPPPASSHAWEERRSAAQGELTGGTGKANWLRIFHPTSLSSQTASRRWWFLALCYWSQWQKTFLSPLPHWSVSEGPAHHITTILPYWSRHPFSGLHKCLMESFSKEINFL